VIALLESGGIHCHKIEEECQHPNEQQDIRPSPGAIGRRQHRSDKMVWIVVRAAERMGTRCSQDADFVPDLGARLDKAIEDKRVRNLHGLIVLRNGRLVLARYFVGGGHARGIGPIGRVTSSPTHCTTFSCSKRIVGLLYGIALQQKIVAHRERRSSRLFSNMPISQAGKAVIALPSSMG
jgi:hypothetical protein